MRIAFTNWSNRMVGGAEHYLAAMAKYLLLRGHAVSLWHQVSAPADRPEIPFGTRVPSWDASVQGMGPAIEGLRQWAPDILFCQGMLDPETEATLLDVAPSVFFAHNYHGTCISGTKCTQFPVARPCERRFGPMCLINYLPRHCGGRNPITMFRSYQLNVRRLEVLQHYSSVVTHSQALTLEYNRHGIPCRQLSYFASGSDGKVQQEIAWTPSRSWRLLMIGRMMPTKGGHLLLQSLPELYKRLKRPISLTIAGDGPMRAQWTAMATTLMQNCPGLEVVFPGWVGGEIREQIFRDSDLLVVPSVWPEPFGLVGIEAGIRCIPSAAYRVGGIHDWLIDGRSGFLAPSDPPTVEGLVQAIEKCLKNEIRYRELRTGAFQIAQQMSIDSHYDDLMSVFEGVGAHSPSSQTTNHQAFATDIQ